MIALLGRGVGLLRAHGPHPAYPVVRGPVPGGGGGGVVVVGKDLSALPTCGGVRPLTLQRAAARR